MKVLGSFRDGRLRRVRSIGVVSVLIVAGLMWIGSAQAVHDTGMFELDGNVVHNAATTPPYDWTSLFGAGGTQLVTPDPSNGPILADTFVDDTDAVDNTYFAGGTKITDPIHKMACGGPAANSKTSMDYVYVALAQIPAGAPDNAGDQVLYLGIEKQAAGNGGDNAFGFWLFQNNVACSGSGPFSGSHTDGDLFIDGTFTNGGGTSNVEVFRWNGNDTTGSLSAAPIFTGTVCGVASNDSVCGIANNSTITAGPWRSSPTMAPNTFVEAGIDMTDLLGQNGGCFSTFLADSQSSQSTNSQPKDFAGGQFSSCVPPIINTTAMPGGSTNPLGVANQHDVATVAPVGNRPDPTGTVSFFLCKPSEVTAGGCVTGGTQVGNPVTIGSGSATSANASGSLTTTPGKYCWRAEYTPDTAGSKFYVAGSHTNSDSECFTVIKASPSITTNASRTGGGVVGTGTTCDSATLSGSFNGTGTITFTLTAPDNSSSQVGAPVTVSGDGTYQSPSCPTLTQVGTYTWSASYSGDTLNNGTVDNGDNESVTSIKACPSIKTQASVTGNGVVGTDSTSDTATVSGGDHPTGTIQFSITDPNNNTTTVGSPVTVNGDGTYNAPSSVPLTLVGTYTWSASYSGDSLNNGTVDNGNNESITSNPASPSIETSATTTGGGVVGTGTTCDSATLSGSFNGTGTITFTLTAPDNSSSQVGAPVTVSGDGTYQSPSCPTLTQVGTYTWSASYSGDTLNNGTVDNGDNESVTSIKASPSIKTQASVTGNGVVGTDSTSDTATVSGGDHPTGTIQFSITDPNNNTTTVGSPVTVNGDGAYNAPSSVPLTLLGTYTWSASYSGDSLNNSAIDNGNNESVTSIKTTPSITTEQDPASGSVGDTFKDKATLSGTFQQSGKGSITWTLYPNDDCSGTPLGTDMVSVDDNGTFETPNGVTVDAGGTYYWVASFSGDANNGSATSGCADEPVVVHGAAIHIVKKADAAHVSVGGQIGFTMTVWNSGDGDAHGVTLSDKLPANPGLSWKIASQGAGWAGSCAINAGELSCGPVTVPAGTTQIASTFTVHITSTTTTATAGDCPNTGVVDNTGSVTTTNDGSDQSNASTCVQAMVDLSITKSGSPATQQLGAGNITWTIVVTNHGPNADTGVKITDPMPGGNTFVSASASPHGTCTGGAILTCDLGTMAADESVTITLVTTPSAAGAQTNTVNVSGNRPETNTTNNSATATVEVTAAPITPPQVFCVAVSKVTPKQLFVGRKTKLNIHVTKQGKAVKGIHVQIKGPKLNVRTKASNSKGAIKQVVKMKKAGVLVFTPIASKKCNTKRVGVTNVFTPPVTG